MFENTGCAAPPNNLGSISMFGLVLSSNANVLSCFFDTFDASSRDLIVSLPSCNCAMGFDRMGVFFVDLGLLEVAEVLATTLVDGFAALFLGSKKRFYGGEGFLNIKIWRLDV